MNRMQEWLKRAADELGVRILVGFEAKLSDGNMMFTQALFPDLGGPLGMIVMASSDQTETSIARDLLAHGFAISTFSEPLPNEEFDLNNYSEMFSEWGWTGDEDSRPSWIP
jgi:hypothetical protein